MYLLDTNHCSQIIFGHAPIAARLRATDPTLIATSTIVQGELIYMAQNSERKAENEQVGLRFLEKVLVYPVNPVVARCYGHLKAGIIARFAPKERKKRRHYKIQDVGIDDNDLWIAATTLVYGCTLVSADRDFQRIQEVQDFPLESWL